MILLGFFSSIAANYGLKQANMTRLAVQPMTYSRGRAGPSGFIAMLGTRKQGVACCISTFGSLGANLAKYPHRATPRRVVIGHKYVLVSTTEEENES